MKALPSIALIGLAAALLVATGACTLTIDPREGDRPAAKQAASAKVAGAPRKDKMRRHDGRGGDYKRHHGGKRDHMSGGHMSRGHMSQGRMSQGRMSQGRMHGKHGKMHGRRFIGRGLGKRRTKRELSVEEVRQVMEGRLAWRGNKRLKLGKVEAKDAKTIVVEVVTVDNSLVRRMEIDRKSGRISWPD